MPRVQFSDVVPPEKRSIRNIPIPTSARRAKTAPSPIKTNVESPSFNEPIIVTDTPTPKYPESNSVNITKKRTEHYYHEDGFPNPKKRRWIFGVLTVFSIVAFVAIMMTIFSSATVSVIPQSQTLAVATKIEVGPEMAGASRVPYEIVKTVKTDSVSVDATDEEMVERKASGKIVVYNNFSSEPQRLIIRTRFESSDGLIYRIPESITVPGKTAAGPGSLEVEVFADEPGEKYNIGKTDFTIPGFKTDKDRYTNFYAKSSSEMSGGLVGKVKKIDANTRTTALQKLDGDLRGEIEKELALQTPSGLVMLSGSVFFESKELPQKDSGSTATLTKEVTGYALMLRKDLLSNVLVDQYLSSSTDWQGIQATIPDFSTIKVTEKPTSVPKAGEMVTLKVEGNALAKAQIDVSMLSEALAGANRNTISSIVQKIAGIESVKVSIRPAWKRSLPDRGDKIYIDIE